MKEFDDEYLNIISICTAYEQGFGFGVDNRDLPNPYIQNTDYYIAWEYGYRCGSSKSK